MKHILIVTAAILAATIAVLATELPGYDDLPTTICKTVCVVEVWIKEAKTSTKVDGPNVLEVLAQVKETVAGEKMDGEIRGKYEEFHAPRPTMPNFNISYANYTGSGQELRTRSNDRVLLFLSGASKEANMFVIVRVEPVEKKKDVQDLFAKKDKKPQPYQAAVASGAQGAPLSVPELIADLRNEVRRLKSEEQFSATTEESHASMLIRTVAEHGKAAVPALTEVLVKEPGLQFCILDALRRIGSDAASAVQTVADLAKGTNDEVRAQAIGTLGKIANSSPVAITALTNALSDSFQPVRATAVRSLAEIGPAAKDAMPALIQAWGTEANTSVRKGIIDAFGLIGSNAEAAVPVLMAVLKDKDPSLRWGAARSLGRIGPGAVKALPALESVAADEADYIRKEVLATIRSIRQGDEKKDNTGSNQVPEDTARVLADPQH